MVKRTCPCRARWVVRVEHGLYCLLAEECAVDAGGDPLTRHVGQALVHELRRVRPALADEVSIEPLARDALQLAEEMELGLVARVAPLCLQEPLREVEQQRRAPQVPGVDEAEVDALADDAFVPRPRRPMISGVSRKVESSVNSASSRSFGSSTR